ncbi:MAG: sugar ABC transporter substrate-binding protein [Spirochaetaceae bacterium]|jgi:multiple sugar transport system substrate-binding protein|nr:sugar ABC transporter substrate-binding protein [Spirochaetaceae bacterium]
MDAKRLDWFLFCFAVVVLGALFFSALNFLPNQFKALGNTTLVFTQWWQDELEADTLEAMVREYEGLNPGITILLAHKPHHTMMGELFSREDGGPPPDIIGLDSSWLYELIRADLLEPLESYKNGAAELEDAGAFPDDTPGEYENWAIPLISFMAPLFYNSPLLEAAGFDRPPKTREEFLTYARALTDPPAGRYGMALALSPESPQGVYRDVFSWIWASGVEAGPETALDFTDPAVIDTLDFLNRLYREGLLSPSPFTKTEDEKRREFMQGRAAMMVGSIPEINRIMEENPEMRLGITTIPPADKYLGRPVFGLTSWYAGISRESRHKDEAWAFLSFLCERRSFLASMAHAVPGNRDEAAGIAGENSLYAKAYDMYTAGEAADQFAGVPGVKELETILREELRALFEGRSTPPETARTIQQRRDAAN